MKWIIICLTSGIILYSCKKEQPQPAVCETSISAIAGWYHFTKMEMVAYGTGVATDITSSLSNCELQAVYHFKTDSTVIYTETAPCSSNVSGTWQFIPGYIHISFITGNGTRLNQAYFAVWDCSKLVLSTAFPSVSFNYRYTLTKFQ